MTQYKQYNQSFGVIVFEKINYEGKSWFFQADNDNTDYQEYLEWVAEGNEPEVIDLAVPEPTE